MTELFAVASLLGFGSSAALAIWVALTKSDLATCRVELRDARSVASRADARAKAAEATKAIDAATIARLKLQLARAAKERNDDAERNAQSGAVGGGDAVLADIRSMYPDADSDG